MKNSKRVVIFLFFILNFSFEIRNSLANDLSVDKRTILIDESVTITVTLENEFASLDTIRVPIENLAFNGLPSVSSEYQWINGASSRRKIFTYSAHPIGSGTATIGPVTLHGFGGQVETLAPITIQAGRGSALASRLTSSLNVLALAKNSGASNR